VYSLPATSPGTGSPFTVTRKVCPVHFAGIVSVVSLSPLISMTFVINTAEAGAAEAATSARNAVQSSCGFIWPLLHMQFDEM
jgi:hypothetical protein